MTNQMTAHGATTRSSYDTALRATGLFGLVGGAAWVIDTVTIAVLNRSFDPLDSVLFIVGLVGLVLTIGALAVHLSAGREGPARAGVAVGAFLATTAVLATVSFAADTLGRHAFSSSNIGLHEEWSCFSTGLVLVAIAVWAGRKARSS